MVCAATLLSGSDGQEASASRARRRHLPGSSIRRQGTRDECIRHVDVTGAAC